MKAEHLALPSVALVVAGVLLGTQRKNVSEMRSANEELRERIAASRVADSPSDPSRPDRPDPRREPIDWDKLATWHREDPDGNAPGMLSIQRRLLVMDSGELLASLDRIDAMELDDKSPVRTRFESAVVFGLFAADPAQAEARLSNLSPTLREEILGKADDFHRMGEGDEIAFAEIARRQLDEKGRVAAIAERARKVIGRGGDFAAVDEYLNSVYAAPDERESSAEAAARQYTDSLARKGEMSAAKLEAMRAWVGRDAPGSVNRLTGEALGVAVNATAGMDFAGASSLALGYRETTGKNEVLHDFLSSLHPGPNNAEARKLAGKISDPMSRDGFLRKFE